VLGFAGLVGSGLHELPYLLVGATKAEAGTITVGDTTIPARQMSPLRATRLGVGLVPSDRRREALVAGRPVAENIGLPQLGSFQQRGWLRRRREVELGRAWIDKLSIAPADPERDVDVLSGGNQQKVVLGKWLGVATAALVVSEPTAGVDIRAKDLIYRELLEQRRLGLPLVVCSTDITDLVRTCTRVIALSDGEAVAEFEGAELTEDNILRVILHRDAGHDREAAR
jgi:ribose transport system ATP-binding protein